MGKTKIMFAIGASGRARNNVIECWPGLLPDRRMGHGEPVFRHWIATERAAAALLAPELVEQRCVGRECRHTHIPKALIVIRATCP